MSQQSYRHEKDYHYDDHFTDTQVFDDLTTTQIHQQSLPQLIHTPAVHPVFTNTQIPQQSQHKFTSTQVHQQSQQQNGSSWIRLAPPMEPIPVNYGNHNNHNSINEQPISSYLIDGRVNVLTKEKLDVRYNMSSDLLNRFYITKFLSFEPKQRGKNTSTTRKGNPNAKNKFKIEDITARTCYYFLNNSDNLTSLVTCDVGDDDKTSEEEWIDKVYGKYDMETRLSILKQINELQKWLLSKGRKKFVEILRKLIKEMKDDVVATLLSLDEIWEWNKRVYGVGRDKGIVKELYEDSRLKKMREDCDSEANEIMRRINFHYHDAREKNTRNNEKGFIHKTYWAGVQDSITRFRNRVKDQKDVIQGNDTKSKFFRCFVFICL